MEKIGKNSISNLDKKNKSDGTLVIIDKNKNVLNMADAKK